MVGIQIMKGDDFSGSILRDENFDFKDLPLIEPMIMERDKYLKQIFTVELRFDDILQPKGLFWQTRRCRHGVWKLFETVSFVSVSVKNRMQCLTMTMNGFDIII